MAVLGMSSGLLRILVVDDLVDAAESLALLLRLLGHEVRVAYSGRQALEAVSGFQPDLVLLDIEMPGMHGGETARLLRRLPGCQNLTIVATSGTEIDDLRLAGFQLEFDEYLQKPYGLNRLENMLARCASALHGNACPDALRHSGTIP
jgi:CheY-like chemotaxis protein